MGKKRKRRLNYKRVVIALAGLIIVIYGIGLLFYKITYKPVMKNIEVEAGTSLKATAFLKENEQDRSISFKKSPTQKQLSTIGDHETTLVVDNDKEYECTYTIKDTKKPSAKVKEVDTYIGQSIQAKDFVSNIKDGTKVKVSFNSKIDKTKEGTQNVSIKLVDQAKNSRIYKSTLTLKEDTVAPIISGTSDLIVAKGDTVSYKANVKVTDNADEDVTLKVDTSNVNLDKIGNYKVTYSAEDTAHNKASVVVTLKVVSASAAPVKTEDVYKKIDPILKNIIKDGMTERQKARAIFNYVKSHIAYTGSSVKNYWQNGAMVALRTGRGDCYNYYALSKAFLTRAGIENFDLSANRASHHYWNFVKIDGKWYHFDTCPRSDHPNTFLRTDAWVTRYSRSHRYCYQWVQKNKPKSATS